MHRLTGLGVVLFLVIHVIDTSWAVFYPELYVEAIAVYQTPLFTIGEFGLVFAVVYHALNGLRIVLFDAKPEWWQYQSKAAWWVVAATIIILVPVFIGMAAHVVDHYAQPDVFMLPLSTVINSQIPFIVGIVVAFVAAIILSGIYGVVAGNEKRKPRSGSNLERFWWSFMRVSGVLIVPLVFGHLAMMHVIQGVFDLTAAGATVVGTNLVNESGTAVEFVAHRWGYLVGGVAIWKLYDIGLLALVTVHGFNCLRYVLTDYTIGAVVLLVVGGGALLGSIPDESIAMAIEATEKLRQH